MHLVWAPWSHLFFGWCDGVIDSACYFNLLRESGPQVRVSAHAFALLGFFNVNKYIHIHKSERTREYVDTFPVSRSFMDKLIIRESYAIIFLRLAVMKGVSHYHRFVRETPSHKKYSSLVLCEFIKLCICVFKESTFHPLYMICACIHITLWCIATWGADIDCTRRRNSWMQHDTWYWSSMKSSNHTTSGMGINVTGAASCQAMGVLACKMFGCMLSGSRVCCWQCLKQNAKNHLP